MLVVVVPDPATAFIFISPVDAMMASCSGVRVNVYRSVDCINKNLEKAEMKTKEQIKTIYIV